MFLLILVDAGHTTLSQQAGWKEEDIRLILTLVIFFVCHTRNCPGMVETETDKLWDIYIL